MAASAGGAAYLGLAAPPPAPSLWGAGGGWPGGDADAARLASAAARRGTWAPAGAAAGQADAAPRRAKTCQDLGGGCGSAAASASAVSSGATSVSFASGVSFAGSGGGAQKLCGQCGTSLQSGSLTMACPHHLCMPCSARGLTYRGGCPLVACSRCQMETQVDSSAARYLKSSYPEAGPSAAQRQEPPGRPEDTAARSMSPGTAARLSRVRALLGATPDAQAARPPALARSSTSPVGSRGAQSGLSGASEARPKAPEEPLTAASTRPSASPSPAAGARPALARAATSDAALLGRGGAQEAPELRASAAAGARPALARAATSGAALLGRGGAQPSSPAADARPALARAATNGAAPRGAAQEAPELPEGPGRPPPSQRCGQCEEAAAEVFCQQCEELFCGTCAASMHRRGKMADHEMTSISHVQAGVAGMSAAASRARARLGEQRGRLARANLGGVVLGLAGMTAAASRARGRIGEERERQAQDAAASQLLPAPMRAPTFGGALSSGAPVAVEADGVAVAASCGQQGQPLRLCPVHKEPLEYWCEDCHVLCAKKATEDHTGHKVLRLDEAFARLRQRSLDLAALARVKAEEFSRRSHEDAATWQKVTAKARDGSKDLEEALALVVRVLHEEEAALQSEAEQCAPIVQEALQASAFDPNIVTLRDSLERRLEAGSAMEALNDFVGLRHALDQRRESAMSGDMAVQLRATLEEGFEARLACVAQMTERVVALRPADRGRSAWPSSPRSPGAGG